MLSIKMTIKSIWTLAFLLTVNVLFLGCVALYKPSVIQSPLLTEKGSARITGSVGMLGTGLFNLQGAYAPKDHVGLLLGGMYHDEKINGETSNPEITTMFYGEAGGGYFTTFGQQKNGLFQCYGGVGMGRSNHVMHNADQSNPRLGTDYASAFLQPGVAFVHKNVDVAFDIRNNFVHLYNTRAFLMDQFEFWNTQSTFVNDTTLNFMLIEPTLTLRFGPERIKGFIQLGLTFPAYNPDVYFDVFGSSLLLGQFLKFSFGVTYLFPSR